VQCAQPRALLTLSGAGPPTAKVVASGGYSNRPLQVATQEGLQHTERSCVATTRVLQPPPSLGAEPNESSRLHVRTAEPRSDTKGSSTGGCWLRPQLGGTRAVTSPGRKRNTRLSPAV
jgi:hypothetical protein